MSDPKPSYTVTEDYAEPLSDGSGRTKVVFRAGTVIGWDTAHALGLVSTKHPPKEDAPPAIKSVKIERDAGKAP